MIKIEANIIFHAPLCKFKRFIENSEGEECFKKHVFVPPSFIWIISKSREMKNKKKERIAYILIFTNLSNELLMLVGSTTSHERESLI